jgi:BatD DUF11 like domain
MPTVRPHVILFVAGFLLATAGRTFSQSFTASVSNTTVSQNEQFEVSFTFAAQDVNGIKGFEQPDFRDFVILSGPNQSTSLQFINGAASGSMTYSYYLRCPKLGKFTIGSASVEYNGKKYTTKPLTIDVTKSSPKPASGAQGSPTVSANDIGDNVFIQATADKRRVYLGEPVTVTYKLYTRLQIASQMQVSKLPSYEGFWAEEINLPNTISLSNEMHDGKEYKVGVLKKVALFPSQLGELSVTPMVLSIPVQIQQRQGGNGNVFDQFFNDPFFNNYMTVNFTAKSNTIKLQVVPLPSKGVPPSFNGAVGDYSLSSDISAVNVKANDPLTFTVTLKGQGNIQLLAMPDFTLPTGFDKYEPKVSQQISRDGTISGTKTFEYLIVPRVAGKKEIPSLKFSYFNPEKRSYITLSTPPYPINVEPGASNGNATVAGYSKEDIKLLGEDIRYIKMSAGDLRERVGFTIFGAGFWSAVVLPLFALGGLITWKRRNDKLAGNLELLHYRRAEKIARGRFKTAKKLMDAGNQRGFYAEISQALFGYLENKLHIPKSEMSLDRAVDELQKRSIDGELVSSLRSCTEKCEFARFAPAGDGSGAMNEMYNELTKVIVGIERTLSVKRHA